MEYQQQKLRRIEWESIEKQIDEKEKNIVKLIKNGMTDNSKHYNFNVINPTKYQINNNTIYNIVILYFLIVS